MSTATRKALGQKVAAAIKTVGQFPFMPKIGGNGFDASARAKIQQMAGLRHVPEQEWKSPKWEAVRKSISAGHFIFDFKIQHPPINNPEPVGRFKMPTGHRLH